MTAWCELKAEKRHGKRVRAQARPAALVDGVEADSDKARVMAHFRGLVANGLAKWQTLDDGTIRLCLSSGETYVLMKTTVTRFA
jgi:hypothetical protein